MNTKLRFLKCAMLSTLCLSAQVGIGTATPSANAALEVSSTSKGLLIPRLSASQQDAMQTPSEGLIVYNTSTRKVQVYTNTETMWITSGLGGTYDGTATIMSGLSVYQVFTAINTQPIQKIQFEFTTGSTGTIQLKIFDGSGIGGSILATTSETINVVSPTSHSTATFTLSSPISLTAGSTYTIQLSSTSTAYVGFNTNNPYSGGDSNNGGGMDLLFGILSTGVWSNLN